MLFNRPMANELINAHCLVKLLILLISSRISKKHIFSLVLESSIVLVLALVLVIHTITISDKRIYRRRGETEKDIYRG